MAERRSSLEKREAVFDPLSAMLMEEETKVTETQETCASTTTSKRLSNFMVQQEKDLGITSTSSVNKNLTPARAGAKTVTVGADVISPAPVALPPSNSDDENVDNVDNEAVSTAKLEADSLESTISQHPKSNVLEDPFEDVNNNSDIVKLASVPPTTITYPSVLVKDRQDTSDSIGSVSELLGTETTTKMSSSNSSNSSTSMRVSNLDQATIQKIKEESSCNITFVEANENEQTLTITGTIANIKNAQKMIRQYVASSANAEEPLLPGEPCLYVDSKNAYYLGSTGKSQPIPGRFKMTDYRFIFEPKDQTTVRSKTLMNSGLFIVPYFTITKFKTFIKNNDTNKFYLNIICKDVRALTFEMKTEQTITAGKLEQIAKMYIFPFSSQQPVKFLFPCTSYAAIRKIKKNSSSSSSGGGGGGSSSSSSNKIFKSEFSGWDAYDVDREIERQSNRTYNNNPSVFIPWFATNLRKCRLNENYELCKTYPNKIYAPAKANDQVVQSCASFRSKNRLPMFSYVHTNLTSLWRSSQPRVGFRHRNQMDEMYLKNINDTNPNQDNKGLYICDCRPYINAAANRASGTFILILNH
jgi:hypothetical protein